MTFYIESDDARYVVVGYNGQTGQAELRGPVTRFHLKLTEDIMERFGWTLTKEDGSHAQLEELQTQLCP